MSLQQKLGQMTQIEVHSVAAGDLQAYELGSVLSGGGGSPPVNDPGSWADMIDGFQQQALDAELRIPLLYGVDAAHGHNNVVGATIFPHNIGLGAAGDPQLVRDTGGHRHAEALRGRRCGRVGDLGASRWLADRPGRHLDHRAGAA